jgi:hypothetical protein
MKSEKQPKRPPVKRPKRKHPKVPLADWIKTQPASTRHGIQRGHFVLPDYVVP